MKYSLLLVFLCPGCTSNQNNSDVNVSPKDTIIETVWQIQDGDTVSGYGIHLLGKDTVIEDFGVNPSRDPK